MRLIQQEEIIKISADLAGRVHHCKQIEFTMVRKCGEYRRNHIPLDPSGHIQFRIHPFPISRDLRQVIRITDNALLHRPDLAVQIFDLIF